MTTRKQLQQTKQGKHRPSFITPYVSLFGIPQGDFNIYLGGRRGRQRKLTVKMIVDALMPGGRE